MAQINLESLEGLKQNKSLSSQTTFKIGGPARWFYEAKTNEKLIKAVKLARKLKISYFILGGGSNILVSDEGFQGLVIKIASQKLQVRGQRLLVEAGVKLAEAVKKTANWGLSGLEFAAGIPGTIGGAIRGNAGAWQEEIGCRVVRVKILDQKNKVSWLTQKDCQFAYRQSRLKKTGEIVLAAELELKKSEKKEIQQKIKENLQKRQAQPKEPSAGCIFVNPKPQSAGVLIEKAGLKGKQVGGAMISPLHANFIVNLGGAKASEVLALMKVAKKKVKKKFGVDLKEEICLVGFAKI